MTIRNTAFKLYKAPFKYSHGYIFDANGKMVADADGNDESIIARVRGWGEIQYKSRAEELQDEIGIMIAEALTVFWYLNKETK